MWCVCSCTCVQVYVMQRPAYNLGCHSLVTGHFVAFCFVLFGWFLNFLGFFYFMFCETRYITGLKLAKKSGWPVTSVSASTAQRLLMHRSPHRASNTWATTHDFQCSGHHTWLLMHCHHTWLLMLWVMENWTQVLNLWVAGNLPTELSLLSNNNNY